MPLEPLSFEPYLRPQIWGGRNLGTMFGKTLPDAGTFGESWELSSQSLHVSKLINHRLAGMTLNELVAKHPAELFGTNKPAPKEFPLLIKLLDCHELLSVQVHPTDGIAQRLLNEPMGKTEAWVVLEVGPNGRIFAGLKPGVTPADFELAMKSGTVDQCLHSFVPKVGDCLFIPAGTVHAVGGGVVMAEVQQTSDATFRLFDWNRVGPDGKPRKLHIKEAMDSINFDYGPRAPQVPVTLPDLPRGVVGQQLVDCPYFNLYRFELTGRLTNPFQDQLSIWIVADDSVEIFGPEVLRTYRKGETILVPADSTDIVHWQPGSSSRPCTLLAATIG